MEFDPDIPANAQDPFAAFEDLDELDNYAEQLADLIQLLAEQHGYVSDGSGNLAATVPSYPDAASVPEAQLAAQTDGDEEPIVIVDGNLYRVTP